MLFVRFVLSVTVLFGLCVSPSQAQPANDMFANRIVLTGSNITVATSSVGATQEPGDPLQPYAIGGASVWWSWTAPFGGFVTISTAGSSFDTVLWVLAGSSLSALTGIAYDDDDPDGGTSTSLVFFDVTGGQTYQIEVDGFSGESGDVRLQLNLQPFPIAPAWALPDPYGVTVNSSSFAGKVMILDFWATWCNPCKAGMPDLVALQDKYRADGLVIVGANVSWSGDTSQDVQDFLVTFSPVLNYQIVMSNSGYEDAYGGIGSVPTIYIIDRQNKIRMWYVGTQAGSTLEQAIIPLLYTSTCLGCTRSGNQMTFRWPATAQPFTLESALSPTGSWSTWPAAPAVINGTNTVQVPMTDLARCFRLRMPY
jgi:thiol-disulfide isomerase/thioredoxin